MRNELRVFFTAVMFYTRIPCPSWVDHSEDYLNKATRYFPLVGWMIGLMAASTLYACHFIFPPSISVLLALSVSVLMTGAFHEDGFADVCDGFGGGWTSERILDIMKDSRVGAYGVIGTILLFSFKIFALTSLLEIGVIYCIKSIILAHVGSRFTAVMIMRSHEYAREDASSKVKPLAKQLSNTDFIICLLWLLPALFIFQHYAILLVMIPLYLLKRYLSSYFQKWIGGYTGDCLGATQQLAFVVILLYCLGQWKFI
ncbi:cobalamin-5'-phosphate synthase [Arcticibacter pallidicorallinus]|uniref:Adenosylcobinamide-GDP ribazoletransferase n=1 Tax=Arcticibacter pallidicorallinus TaxID=1259464 RepID=A0A2T0TQU6_9SPHI|nr:adenosylcobinamide-GDP ribazoletransferase [Arcticibacter pallidicorallinus]PRY48046.1 cobalamin-5'-phosphate synthase [Arcticibacter pallidicorallinus]